MDHDAESASTEQRGAAALPPIVRPVRVPLDGDPGPGAGGGGGVGGPRSWLRDRRVRTAGAVVLGAVIGLVPGAVLAVGARLDSKAAEERAVAAEQAVRVWQQEAAEASGVAPSRSALTASPPTGRATPGGSTGGGTAPSAGPSGAPSAGPSGTPSERPRRIPGDGTFLVGPEMRAGTWKSKANNGCHWERQRDTSNGRIVVGYGNPYGDVTVTVRPTDDRFKTSKCNDWFRVG
jgi:hypothetical protein